MNTIIGELDLKWLLRELSVTAPKRRASVQNSQSHSVEQGF